MERTSGRSDPHQPCLCRCRTLAQGQSAGESHSSQAHRLAPTTHQPCEQCGLRHPLQALQQPWPTPPSSWPTQLPEQSSPPAWGRTSAPPALKHIPQLVPFQCQQKHFKNLFDITLLHVRPQYERLLPNRKKKNSVETHLRVSSLHSHNATTIAVSIAERSRLGQLRHTESCRRGQCGGHHGSTRNRRHCCGCHWNCLQKWSLGQTRMEKS